MIEVKIAEESHISGITSVWKELMDYHKDLNPFFTLRIDADITWEGFLRKKMQDSLVIIALDEGKVIAYCIAMVKDYPPLFLEEKHGFISDMCVASSHRRNGVGEKVLIRVLEWFTSQGLDRVELRVEHDNEIGKSFWKKHGFKVSYYTLLRQS